MLALVDAQLNLGAPQVCCSVLQPVAVYWCVAVCCSVLQEVLELIDEKLS